MSAQTRPEPLRFVYELRGTAVSRDAALASPARPEFHADPDAAMRAAQKAMVTLGEDDDRWGPREGPVTVTPIHGDPSVSLWGGWQLHDGGTLIARALVYQRELKGVVQTVERLLDQLEALDAAIARHASADPQTPPGPLDRALYAERNRIMGAEPVPTTTRRQRA